MVNIELRIAVVDLAIIDRLLKLLDISQQIINSHFYYNKQDINYSNDIKWGQYFSSPSTGYLHVGQIFLGKFFKDAMIIISGNESIVDFIIEFQVEYMTDEDINNIKKFILKYNPDISDEDIEVICEEY
ncbi:hypothetical protein K1I86_02455 [Streptococcus cristatus]|uniref:Uncharacterized protein n=2 Tax=Streptococcus cristatus TaxID=45634 RepID=A0A428HMM3_STRCR|nr:hypothetical protein [Streptococcus cristatus]MBZ2151564.1 hypothetical protein [Streptococcus cristatus]RSJ97077.1 hypothetical protein D8790_02205 [Streptococcus cristatus]